jgi:hypothetical protein
MRPISAKTSSGSAALFNTLRSFPAICARSQRERAAADVEEVGDNVSTKLQDLVDSTPNDWEYLDHCSKRACQSCDASAIKNAPYLNPQNTIPFHPFSQRHSVYHARFDHGRAISA